MNNFYDVAILGLGAMGSTAARFLSRRGRSVIAFDSHMPPHDLGSSHGRTRMIREAYFEHPVYVHMVRRAYELWRDMEHESGGRTFFRRTGGLMIGPEAGTLFQGTLRSAVENRIPHEVLSSGKLHRRFPALAPLDDMMAVFETRAGILYPDQIIAANLEFAKRRGADLHTGEGVVAWEPTADGVDVRTARGTYRAKQLVISVGSRAPELLHDLSLPLQVERQVSHWMEPSRFPEYFAPDRMPVSLWELPSGGSFYTIPDLGEGMKVGLHHGGTVTTPDAISRTVTHSEDSAVFDLLRRFVPFGKGEILDRAVCMYTNTPDRHFVIDRHPRHEAVIVVSACSGHGFKFAPAIAEWVADVVEG
ncbi:MAG: N-methyl-L-tryptophan oxidase, partial [Gemmatimonadaceae bacterium]